MQKSASSLFTAFDTESGSVQRSLLVQQQSGGTVIPPKFEDGNYTVVQAICGSDPTIRTLRLPISIPI